MTPRAPLLTAEDAETLIWMLSGQRNLLRGKVEPDMHVPRLQALADGRTANVRVLTEDECRAEFEAHYGKEPGSLGSELPYIMWQARLLAWLACARAMGAVR